MHESARAITAHSGFVGRRRCWATEASIYFNNTLYINMISISAVSHRYYHMYERLLHTVGVLVRGGVGPLLHIVCLLVRGVGQRRCWATEEYI